MDGECFFDKEFGIHVFLCGYCSHFESCSVSAERAQLDRQTHYEDKHPELLAVAPAAIEANRATAASMLLSV